MSKESLQKRKERLIEILEKGPCTLRYAHYRLNQKEKGLAKSLVDKMVRHQMPEVFLYHIKDLVYMEGIFPRAQKVVVLKLKDKK